MGGLEEGGGMCLGDWRSGAAEGTEEAMSVRRSRPCFSRAGSEFTAVLLAAPLWHLSIP